MVDAALAELAHAHGVATEYGGWRGGAASSSSSAIIRVLRALGVNASTPEAIAAALKEVDDAAWRRMLPRYVVAQRGRARQVAMHVWHGDPASVTLELEDGRRRQLVQLMVWVEPREVGGRLVGEATFEIPDDVPLGYHRLRAVSGDREASSLLIVAPDRIAAPARRAWGIVGQLYQARSRRSWSIGDLRDLRDLVTWSGRELGAGFVLVNPLHAAQLVPPMEPSPYFPSSRRFLNPLYLCVDEVPEVGALASEEVAAIAKPLLARNSTGELLDRDAVWAAKREVLERAYATRRNAEPADEFAAFLAGEGQELVDFATWCALADRHGLPWRSWPAELVNPSSTAVADFRAAEKELIGFHCWLQWLCARQLDDVQRAAREGGMPIGVVHDLAVGVSPDGADAWALRDVFAEGVSLGAPADMYNQQGQRWNLPPWRPDRLAEADFQPFRKLVRASLSRGGGLRVDHVIGLFRQWWVPDGALASDGAYVRLDHEAFVGIVALEACRAGGVVVGEDLGNVEPWVRDYLRERGILGTSILWFEEDDGRPRPPGHWRELCLATVTTHDLPPTAGFLTGRHVDLRAGLGLLERSVDEERAVADADRDAWLRALVDAGLLDPAVAEAPIEANLDRIVDALHGYVVRTPSLLAGVYLPDIVGDRRPINQPGTVDEYPNWRLPMADGDGRPVLLDHIFGSERARELAAVMGGSVTNGSGSSVTVASIEGSTR